MVRPLLYISHFKGDWQGCGIYGGGGGGGGGDGGCGGGGAIGGTKGIHTKVVENVKGNTIWHITRIVHKIRCTTRRRRIGEGYLISTQKAFRLRYYRKWLLSVFKK